MKFHKILLTLFIFLFIAITINAADQNYTGDKSEIEKTITSYVKSIDSQNANTLEKSVVEKGAIVTVNTITNKLEDYTISQFVNLVKNRQKGGWTRNLNVNSIEISGNTAVAKVEISDARMLRSGFFTLIKENKEWKIASEVSTIQLKK